MGDGWLWGNPSFVASIGTRLPTQSLIFPSTNATLRSVGMSRMDPGRNARKEYVYQPGQVVPTSASQIRIAVVSKSPSLRTKANTASPTVDQDKLKSTA